MILLDTNIVSALMRSDSAPAIVNWLNSQDHLSIWTTSITVLEIEYGLSLLPAGRRATALRKEWEAVLVEDIGNRVASFDLDAACRAGELMARRQAQGRVGDWRDTQIAGIALACGAAIATANRRHFEDVGVALLDPRLTPS